LLCLRGSRAVPPAPLAAAAGGGVTQADAGHGAAPETTENEPMTRHPTARRVHRQDTTPDDTFVAGVLETSAWAQQHKRSLIIGGVAVAVVAVTLFLWLNHRSNLRSAAEQELTQVRAVAMSGNPAVTIRELEAYLSRFGGTPSAGEARLLLARAYMDAGQTQQALETVQSQARDVSGPLGVNAAFLQAAAYEAAQETQRAEEAYLRIADGARFLFQKQEGLDHAARLRLQRGDVAGAITLYERALEITPEGNADRGVFEMRLGEARALAASPSPVGAEPPPTAPATAPLAPSPAQPGGEVPPPEGGPSGN
jgi:predicted negative regulator of RcsB-dependent stress response